MIPQKRIDLIAETLVGLRGSVNDVLAPVFAYRCTKFVDDIERDLAKLRKEIENGE